MMKRLEAWWAWSWMSSWTRTPPLAVEELGPWSYWQEEPWCSRHWEGIWDKLIWCFPSSQSKASWPCLELSSCQSGCKCSHQRQRCLRLGSRTRRRWSTSWWAFGLRLTRLQAQIWSVNCEKWSVVKSWHFCFTKHCFCFILLFRAHWLLSVAFCLRMIYKLKATASYRKAWKSKHKQEIAWKSLEWSNLKNRPLCFSKIFKHLRLSC